MLLSIATSRASASCTEKAWGIQILCSVVLIYIEKKFDFSSGEMRVRVVSPSYIFAHEIETIFTSLYETPPLHSLLWIAPSLGIKQRLSLSLSMHFLFCLVFTSIIYFPKRVCNSSKNLVPVTFLSFISRK